jgi:hypothetical protein
MAGLLALGGLVLFYILRKLFDRRRGTRFPSEGVAETEDSVELEEAAENSDPTLIT